MLLRASVIWLGILVLAIGHYLFGDSWDRLLADYNILRGRIWLLVPIVTLVAPLLAQSLHTK